MKNFGYSTEYTKWPTKFCNFIQKIIKKIKIKKIQLRH